MMGYNVYLVDPETKEVLETEYPHHIKGGVHALGGTTCLELYVTYNYGKFFRRSNVLGEKGLLFLNGKLAKDTLPILKRAINALHDDSEPRDYWEPTEGNAKKALYKLYSLALLRPDGEWQIE